MTAKCVLLHIIISVFVYLSFLSGFIQKVLLPSKMLAVPQMLCLIQLSPPCLGSLCPLPFFQYLIRESHFKTYLVLKSLLPNDGIINKSHFE